MKKLLVSIFVLGLMFGCSNKEESKKTKVITSLYPLYDMTRSFIGDHVEVVNLIPSGVDVHHYSPTPEDIKNLSDADILICLGKEVEPWLEDLLEGINNDELKVIDVFDVINIKGDEYLTDKDEERKAEGYNRDDYIDEHGNLDPHIWLDPKYAFFITGEIVEGLMDIDIKYHDIIWPSKVDFIEKMYLEDERYTEKLKDCKHDKVVIAGHNAYRYVSKRYGFNIISAYGVSPDSEPNPKLLKEIIDIVKKDGIKYILYEKAEDMKFAEILAKETGTLMLEVYPMGNVPKDMFGVPILDLFEINLKSFQTALECEL